MIVELGRLGITQDLERLTNQREIKAAKNLLQKNILEGLTFNTNKIQKSFILNSFNSNSLEFNTVS